MQDGVKIALRSCQKTRLALGEREWRGGAYIQDGSTRLPKAAQTQVDADRRGETR